MPRSTARTILQPLAIAIACALIVRGAFFRVYAIPSASMAPTLQPGDQIVVTPYRAPFARVPRRGDVVVFRSPLGRDELLIKRIVATPGDLIASDAGRVTLGGHLVAEPYVQRAAAPGACCRAISSSAEPASCCGRGATARPSRRRTPHRSWRPERTHHAHAFSGFSKSSSKIEQLEVFHAQEPPPAR